MGQAWHRQLVPFTSKGQKTRLIPGHLQTRVSPCVFSGVTRSNGCAMMCRWCTEASQREVSMTRASGMAHSSLHSQFGDLG